MKFKHVLGLAAAVGAASAVYSSIKEDRAHGNETTPDVRLFIPISTLISGQDNIEILRSSTLRDIFKDKTNQNTENKVMIVTEIREGILEPLGFKKDMELDKDHYLLCLITEKGTNTVISSSLINYSEIEEKLSGMLASNNGLLRVSGETKM